MSSDAKFGIAPLKTHRMPGKSLFYERLLPAILLGLGVITAFMIVFAVGRVGGSEVVAPTEAGSATATQDNSPVESLLSLGASLVMIIYSLAVFQRWIARRDLAFLFWGIGLFMYGLGSLAQAYLSLAWSEIAFMGWWLFGALLNPAWLGQGTLNLLVRRTWVKVLNVILLAASVGAAALMLTATLDASGYQTGPAISEQYMQIMAEGQFIRFPAPAIFGSYGLVMLVGGALYSGYLFWRKRVLPNRVLGNVLIAAGGMVSAGASSLTRLGYGQFLPVSLLIGALLMYGGFLLAAAPGAQTSQTDEKPPAAPASLPSIQTLTSRRMWANVLITLGVLAWLPFFILLATGTEVPVLPFLATHLCGVLGGAYLRSKTRSADSAHPETKSLRTRRIISMVLIYLGVLAWAPYFYFDRVLRTETEIAPFLAAHLTGVLGGAALRISVEVQRRAGH